MRSILFCLGFLLTSSVVAQTDTLAALQQELKKPLSTEERIDLLNQLSRAYSEASLATAEDVANEALQLSESIDYQKGIASAYNNLGVYSSIRGEYTVGMDDFVKALQIRERLHDAEGTSRTLNNITRVYVLQEDFDKALEYSTMALEQLKKADDPEAVGNAHVVLGSIYMGKKDYLSALKMFSEAGEIFRRKKLKSQEGGAFVKIAAANEQQGNYEAALQACAQAKELLNVGKDMFLTIELYQGAGSVYTRMKNEKEASLNLHRAMKMADERDDSNGRLSSRLKLSDMYRTFGRLDSALFYMDTYQKLHEQIFSAEKSKQVAALEKIYQTVRKDQLLEAKNYQIRSQNIVIAIISSLLVVLVVLGVVLYRYYRDKKQTARRLEALNRDIYDKHEEILAQSEELSEANEEIRRINESLEQEVLARAARIKRQNEMLIEYAYFNAHNVRGPLARILGLTQLMTVEKSEDMIRQYNTFLSVSAQELDGIVREINVKLQDGQ